MVSNIQNLRFTNSVEIPQNKVQTQLRPKNSETQQDSFEKSGLSKKSKTWFDCCWTCHYHFNWQRNC